MFCAGARVAASARVKRVVDSAFESEWTVVDGGRMHARVCRRASGLPIVMVHGLVVASTYLMPTAQRLAMGAPVFLPELPGFGRSEPPEETLDIDASANVLSSWMREAGVPRALVVANSVGCQVAVALAEGWPSAVAGLVLTSPTYDRSARSFTRPIFRWLRNAPREPLSLLPIIARDWAAAGLKRSLESYLATLDDAIEARLFHVRCPTLVVRGARDPVSPHAWAEELARRLTAGRLIELPRVAHTLNYTAPESLARLCLQLRDEVEGHRLAPPGDTPQAEA